MLAFILAIGSVNVGAYVARGADALSLGQLVGLSADRPAHPRVHWYYETIAAQKLSELRT